MMQRLNIDILNDGSRNKDLAFTSDERKTLHLEGLLPALGEDSSPHPTKEVQDYHFDLAFDRFNSIKDPLDRYDWIMQLGDRNKKIFYLLLSRKPAEVMPYVYTPTVGLACQQLSKVFRFGRGMFISIKQKGRISEILENWPEKNIQAICVTDGERILGLGDLGAFGMGIPVGKLALYTALAGIHPESLLPVTLDVGTNNKDLLSRPDYFGLRSNRVDNADYDEFIEEFMQACVKKYGNKLLIQFEDFANHNAFRLLQKYANQYCTFNDDIQGTASVVLAALLGSERLTGRKLRDERIVCFGAGEAALGFAELVVLALEKREGMTTEQAKENIWLVDSKGLIVADRSTGGLTPAKLEFARPKGTTEVKDLMEIVKIAKATALIGASAVPNSFSSELLKLMAELTPTPVIMALSNPTSKAECTAIDAYVSTKGKCIFASGSPFDEVEVPGVSARRPAQANNAYVFPGVALGIITGSIFPVTNMDFLIAAETVSNMASDDDLKHGCVLPTFEHIREVSRSIAYNVIETAKAEGRCSLQLEAKNLQDIIYKNSIYPFE